MLKTLGIAAAAVIFGTTAARAHENRFREAGARAVAATVDEAAARDAVLPYYSPPAYMPPFGPPRVEWLGPISIASEAVQTMPEEARFHMDGSSGGTFRSDVEIGLREDGAVVWRRRIQP